MFKKGGASEKAAAVKCPQSGVKIVKNTHTYMHNTQKTIQTNSPAGKLLVLLDVLHMTTLVSALGPLGLWEVLL